MWEGSHPDACSKAWDTGWTMKRVCQSFWNYTLRRSSEKPITCYLFPPYSLNLLPSLSNLFPLPSDGFLPGFRLLRGLSQQHCLLSGFLILIPVSLLILNSMACVLELGPALPKPRSNQLRSGWEMDTLRASLAGLPWWSSGYDSTLPMQRTQVGSQFREPDPACCN